MKFLLIVGFIFLAAPLQASELNEGPQIGFGLYGGTIGQASRHPTQSSLTSGIAELSFGLKTSRFSSWHLALQSIAMEGPLSDQIANRYEGFRVSGRYIADVWRLRLIAGLGAGSVVLQESNSLWDHDEPNRSQSYISPELGLGFALYQGESMRLDLTAMSYLFLGDGHVEIPKNAVVQQIGLNLSFATGNPSNSGRTSAHIHVDGNAMRALGHFLRFSAQGGAAAARGIFTVMGSIR